MFFVGCGDSKDDRKPPIIVITSPDNPPFEFKDTAKKGGQVIGFDIDVIKRLSEKMGRPIKIIEAEFNAIIPALKSGRADIGIAGITATEERRKSVDFSMPYYTNKIGLLVPEESALVSEKDLAGRKLGVQLGTTHEVQAKKWRSSMVDLNIIPLNKTGDLVQELKSGRIDAVLLGKTEAQKIANSTIGIKFVPLDVTGESFVIVFPKGSKLVGPVNQALTTMADDVKNFEQKWLVQ
jgi:polar amino acid transport system substrate-binding protein